MTLRQLTAAESHVPRGAPTALARVAPMPTAAIACPCRAGGVMAAAAAVAVEPPRAGGTMIVALELSRFR